ncbi:MAG TPA: hypothetical protein VIQ22_05430 [Gammaproteobacteria bacterium]
MKRFLFVIITLSVATPLAAQCLSVKHKEIDPQAQDAGAARVGWQASLDNRCEYPQDALLDVKFLGKDGEVLYEVRDQTVVGRLGSKKLKRRVYVPTQHIEAIEALRIELEERERPM